MKIQLITIGNELLNGKIQDKNAYWLAKFCYEHNIELCKNQIIPDSEEAFMRAMEEAWSNSHLVVTSGGLGPTKDDLTKALAGKFFGKELKENEHALEIARKNYEKSNREYNTELDYSKIPEGFEAVYNAAGYAPGLTYKADSKMLAVLPGVPSEFNRMFTEEIYPRAQKLFSTKGSIKKHVIVKTWKVPEAKIFNELCPGLWEELEAFGEVSSLPHPLGVDVGVVIEAPSEQMLQEAEKQVLDTILATKLKEHVWHIGPELIEELIVKKAKEKNMTIGFAESCTGGLLASRITDVAGSSEVFLGSVIAYHNDVKTGVLGVNESTLKKYGAVSQETAWEMAGGARKVLAADLVVATTGIAGPGGGSFEKPVGTIGIGYSSERHCASDLFHFPERERLDMKYVFSQAALYTMLEQINLFERKA